MSLFKGRFVLDEQEYDPIGLLDGQKGWVDVTILTENNGWAIVWMNNRYYLRHNACGSYLLRRWRSGCLCNARERAARMKEPTKVDDMILKKFKLVTKGEI